MALYVVRMDTRLTSVVGIINRIDMKPSNFTKQPIASVLQKSEAETIARNIMVILKRTGDSFRPLSWDEYKAERLKDGHFTESENGILTKLLVIAQMLNPQNHLAQLGNSSSGLRPCFVALLDAKPEVYNLCPGAAEKREWILNQPF